MSICALRYAMLIAMLLLSYARSAYAFADMLIFIMLCAAGAALHDKRLYMLRHMPDADSFTCCCRHADTRERHTVGGLLLHEAIDALLLSPLMPADATPPRQRPRTVRRFNRHTHVTSQHSQQCRSHEEMSRTHILRHRLAGRTTITMFTYHTPLSVFAFIRHKRRCFRYYATRCSYAVEGAMLRCALHATRARFCYARMMPRDMIRCYFSLMAMPRARFWRDTRCCC